ncbi:MAG TPA: histidine kinase [Mycobacteriales bacterium]|nr:histidine kinase [Mycobacteriales bacterium]
MPGRVLAGCRTAGAARVWCGAAAGLTGVVAALDVAVALAAGHRSTLFWASELVVAAAWAATGLAASILRPDRRAGRLMQLAGLVFMVDAPAGFALGPGPGWVDADATLARLVNPVQVAVLAQLLLSYPTGRLRSRAERALLAGCYGYAAMVGGFATAQAQRLTAACGWACAVDRSGIADAGTSVLLNTGWLLLSGGYVWLLARRVRRASAADRRALAYPLGTGAVLVAIFLAGAVLAAAGSTGPATPPRLLSYALEYAALLAMPGALLVGLLRERLSYATVAELVRLIDRAPDVPLPAGVRRALRDPLLVGAVTEARAGRRRLLEAGLDQRRRLERDLHDGAQQRLLSAKLALLTCPAGDDPATVAALRAARQELQGAIDELRELARGIHPAVLTEQGLGAAARGLALRAPLPVSVTDTLPGRLGPQLEAAAYFVISEALANVAKHAGAASASVRLETVDGRLRVTVSDDGTGGVPPVAGLPRPDAVTPGQPAGSTDLAGRAGDGGSAGGHPSARTGLVGLAERVAAFDGSLLVSSGPAGTTLLAEFRCG